MGTGGEKKSTVWGMGTTQQSLPATFGNETFMKEEEAKVLEAILWFRALSGLRDTESVAAMH